MQQITTEQFNTALGKTPFSVQDVGFKEETSQKIYNLSTRHNVANSSSDIAAVIGYVLVGLVPIKNFIQALQEDVGLDEKTAKNVAHDVRAEIFAPVAKELAAMQEQAEKNWKELHGQDTAPKIQETGGENATLAAFRDESVVRELFPQAEVDENKFDTGLEKPEKREGNNDERF